MNLIALPKMPQRWLTRINRNWEKFSIERVTLEQGKQTLRLDKVNQILNLFGCEVGVVPITKTDER